MNTYEVNFDGLIGPTHNYSGLSEGNLASQKNAHQIASPRRAALQGLNKMEALLNMGIKQGFLPPQQRPRTSVLRQLGFSGDDKSILQQVAKRQPQLLSLVYSASSMWAANAATVTASVDSTDGRVQFTPANLLATPHRTLEADETYRSLGTIFNNDQHFNVHAPLPGISILGDEGAANHNRLCASHAEPGIYVFVYGRDLTPSSSLHFPARQCRLASEAVARQHGLSSQQCVFVPQNPLAINAGAFHNDVVAVANTSVLFFHEQAFAISESELQEQLHARGSRAQLIAVPAGEVSLADAVQSYLFNSQLISLPEGGMCLLAPQESELNPRVNRYLKALVADADNPINQVLFMDLRESMRNGGGPACLRLRVVMNDAELAACHSEFLLSLEKIAQLKNWVNKHYRDTLSSEDLADPNLLEESYTALDELTRLLGITGYYEFQR